MVHGRAAVAPGGAVGAVGSGRGGEWRAMPAPAAVGVRCARVCGGRGGSGAEAAAGHR